MSKWRFVKLGEVATYINGYAFKPSDWSDEGLPIIRIQDLTGNNYETNYFHGNYDKKYEINDGDILISWSASLGIYKWNRGKALLNQHIFKVVFDKLNVDKSYYAYAVDYLINDMAKETHGSTMKHITKPRFDNTPFPYPPITEQRQIAETLEKVDRIIFICNNMLIKYDLLVKSQFVEMFGDPIDNPREWEKKQLQEIVTDDCTISYGIVQTGDEQKQGIPVFRPVDIVNRTPKLEELKKTTPEISNKYKRTILKGREMLITVRANIADTCIVGEEFKGCNVGRGIVPIRTNEDIIILDFLKHQLDSKHLNDYIKSLAKGITLIQLNMEDLRGIAIMIPPLTMQRKFVDFVQQIDKSKFVVYNLIKNIRRVKFYD